MHAQASREEGFQAYIDAASELRPLLTKYRAQEERDRIVHPDVVAALRAARLFQLPKPRSRGGLEAPMSVSFEVLRIIAQGNISASWIMMACGAHAFMCGMFPEELHQKIDTEDPDWILAGGSAPLGRAVRCEGGWRLSGSLPFASGVDHAAWTIAGAQVVDGGKGGLPPAIITYIPKRDLRIEDNWYTMGLRATGSKVAVAEDVFVPENHSMPVPALIQGRSEHGLKQETFLYSLPHNMVVSFFPAGTLLGAAEDLLETYVDLTRVRTDKYYGSQKAQSAGLQFRVAEAHHQLHAARALFRDLAARLDDYVANRRRPTLEERAEFRSACAYGIQMCRKAVDRLFAAAGANACYDTSPLQQAFRDINVGAHHGTVDYDSWVEQYGRMRLGLEPTKPL